MSKPSAFVVAVVLTSLAATGCPDQKAREIDRLRAETEAARAEAERARAEAEATRAELVHALAEAQVARTELARLRGEPVPPAPGPRAEPAAEPIEKRFAALKANYDKSTINLSEWGQLKARVIDGIPKEVPIGEKRTLGQRLIDLHAAYNSSAISLSEWGTVKGKLIAQAPAPRAPALNLDKELGDLKRAYDASAISLSEWNQAKANVTRWAR